MVAGGAGLEDLDAAICILATVAAAEGVDDQDLLRAPAGPADAHTQRYAVTGARPDLDARIERPACRSRNSSHYFCGSSEAARNKAHLPRGHHIAAAR